MLPTARDTSIVLTRRPLWAQTTNVGEKFPAVSSSSKAIWMLRRTAYDTIEARLSDRFHEADLPVAGLLAATARDGARGCSAHASLNSAFARRPHWL